MNTTLIDTDILTYFLKGDQKILEKTTEYLVEHDRLIISRISEFEILAGLHHKQAVHQMLRFKDFVSKCSILTLTTRSIQKSAEIYGQLRKSGIQIGTPDLLIAGIAIDNGLELATNNIKHFGPITQLKINTWKK